MALTRHERGFAGHFIMSSDCLFHRNTLVTDGDRHIIVSTVGNCRPSRMSHDGRGPGGQTRPRIIIREDAIEIGLDRFYETMIFAGVAEGSYIEADVSRQLSCEEPWSIPGPLLESSDMQADMMHEANVTYVMRHFDEMLDRDERDRRDVTESDLAGGA